MTEFDIVIAKIRSFGRTLDHSLRSYRLILKIHALMFPRPTHLVAKK